MGFERLVIAAETTIGVNPGAGFVTMPFTSFDLGRRPRSVTSAENTEAMTPPGSSEVANEQGGGYNFELRLGVLNELIEGLTLSPFSSDLSISTTVSSVASGNLFTATANAFTSVAVGQWIKVGGLHASVNGYHHVISKSDANTIGVASTLADHTSSGVEVIGSYTRRGGTAWTPTEKTFSIEKQFRSGSLASTDTAYLLSLMNYVQSMRISAVVEQLLTGNVTFLGQAETSSDSSAAGTPAAGPASELVGPVLGLPVLYEGTFASVSTLRRAEISLDWNNNHAPDRDLGSGSVGIGSVTLGIPTITATMRVNMKSPSIRAFLSKVESQTRTKLAWRYEDTLGNAMFITLPSVRIEDAPWTVEGNQGTRFSNVRFAVETAPTGDVMAGVGAQIDFFVA